MLLFGLNSDLLSTEVDGKTATYILSTIREEEQQTEMLKRQTASIVAIGAADAIDSSGVAAEQSFNREQVQEQEQVRPHGCFLSFYILNIVVDRMLLHTDAVLELFECMRNLQEFTV